MPQHAMEAELFCRSNCLATAPRARLLGRVWDFYGDSNGHYSVIGLPRNPPKSSIEGCLRFILSTIESEGSLESEASQTLPSPIVNANDKRRDKRERDTGSAQYTSRYKLLMQPLESPVERLWTAKTQAALLVWLGWLAELLEPDGGGSYWFSLLKYGEILLPIGEPRNAQSCQNDPVFRGVQYSGHFSIFTSDVKAYFVVTPRSHTYMIYHCERKVLLRRAFLAKDAEILPSFVFVGYGYAPHGESAWHESHCVWYHMYLIPENFDLPDDTALAYRDSTHVGSGADLLSAKKAGGTEEVDVDVEDSEKGRSKISNGKSLKFSNFNLETGSIPDRK